VNVRVSVPAVMMPGPVSLSRPLWLRRIIVSSEVVTQKRGKEVAGKSRGEKDMRNLILLEIVFQSRFRHTPALISSKKEKSR